MFEFDMLQSCLVIVGLLVVGEIGSRLLKAAVPSFLIAGLLFVAALWSGLLPSNLVETSGLTVLTPTAIMLVIVHMGTTTNIKELLANWRVVALAALSFAGQLVMLFLVIGGVFGQNMAVGSLPGGMATALIVQEQARVLGYDHIVILSVLLLSVQGMVACPIVSAMLKMEVKRLRKTGLAAAAADPTKTAVSAAPKKGPAESHYWPLMRLFAAAWVASRIELLTGFPKYVLCLFLGVIFAELGFLKKNEMNGTNSQGFIFFMMVAMMMGGYAAFTPQMLVEMLVPLVCVLVCEVGSIVLFCALIGPRFGFSRPMSVAIGFNVMAGFPTNLMLTEDVVSFLTEDQEERAALMSQVGTKMVIAGFTSTTFLATVAAGFLVTLMH